MIGAIVVVSHLFISSFLVHTRPSSLFYLYGWNHRNTTWTSIQISQLLEWVRPCKWVRSKATGHVHSPKYTISRDILYSSWIFVDITTKFSKNINPNIRWGKFFYEKFLWKNFFRKVFDHEKSLYHMITRTHREIRFLWVFLLSWWFFFMCFMKFPF